MSPESPPSEPPIGTWSAEGVDFVAGAALGVAAAAVFTAIGALAVMTRGLVQMLLLLGSGLIFTVLVGLCLTVLWWTVTETDADKKKWLGSAYTPDHSVETDASARKANGSLVVGGTGLVAGAMLAWMATLTAVLVQRGTVPPHTGARNLGLLGDLDGLYAWNVLNLVPLLSVPTTLGWREPAVVGGHLAGALLLIFKLVVLVVFVRLGVIMFKNALGEPG
jgi:hypothetical protein